jgi:DNA-binding CsgD family transcriptional regulator
MSWSMRDACGLDSHDSPFRGQPGDARRPTCDRVDHGANGEGRAHQDAEVTRLMHVASFHARCVEDAMAEILQLIAQGCAGDRHVVCPVQTEARFDRLSPREWEVMRLLVSPTADTTNKGIARRLRISPRTVEAHRARVMRKLAARSIADLVVKARDCGVTTVQVEN